MTTINGKTIPVSKKDSEGIIEIDAMTGTITTPPGERPDWAEGLAVAMLAERVGYYEKALGATMAEDQRHPEQLHYEDLSWIGVDAEGDEVEVEAIHQFRSEKLAEVLGISTDADNWEDTLQGQLAMHEVEHTYVTHPTDERTLAEAEGVTFQEAEKKAAQG